MSGAGKKIEEAATALEKGFIKKAMLITDSVKTEAEHKLVVEIAKKCIKEKDNCNTYCKEGAVKLKAAITPTTENNDDLGDVLAAEENRAQEPESNESLVKTKAIDGDTPPPTSDMTPPKTPPPPEKPVDEKTADELFLDCPDCNVAAAAANFVKIAQKDVCDGDKAMAKLQPCLDNDMTTPEKWIKTMTEVTETATCDKQKYGEVLGGLTEYLHSKGDVFLNNLDKE